MCFIILYDEKCSTLKLVSSPLPLGLAESQSCDCRDPRNTHVVKPCWCTATFPFTRTLRSASASSFFCLDFTDIILEMHWCQLVCIKYYLMYSTTSWTTLRAAHITSHLRTVSFSNLSLMYVSRYIMYAADNVWPVKGLCVPDLA